MCIGIWEPTVGMIFGVLINIVYAVAMFDVNFICSHSIVIFTDLLIVNVYIFEILVH